MKPRVIVVTLLKEQPSKAETFGNTDLHVPVIFVVTGCGVLTKNYDAQELSLRRITENDEILWSINGDKISFVRRSLIQEQLETHKNIIQLKMVGTVDRHLINTEITRYESEFTNLKRLVRCDDFADIVCRAWERKLRIPLLAGILVVLVANFLVNNHLQQKSSALQFQLRQTLYKAEVYRGKRENSAKLAEQIRPVRKSKSSVIIDRIASRLPDQISFTYIVIDPVRRGPENGHPAQLKAGSLIIRGIAKNAESVNETVRKINDLKICHELNMNNISQGKDSKSFLFEWEGKL